MAGPAGRRLRSLGSIAHGWEDGTISSWTPNQEFDEGRIREGTTAEHKAFVAAALAAGLLEDITPAKDDAKAGSR
jgi:hypothetical protein